MLPVTLGRAQASPEPDFDFEDWIRSSRLNSIFKIDIDIDETLLTGNIVQFININIWRGGLVRLQRNVRMRSGTPSRTTKTNQDFSIILNLTPLTNKKTIKAVHFYFDEIGR